MFEWLRGKPTGGVRLTLGRADVRNLLVADTIAMAGPMKLPSHIERFSYRLDRGPQRQALRDHISAIQIPSRPICIIGVGIDDDLPNTLGTAIYEFANDQALHARRFLEFLPPRTPICRLWSSSLVDCDSIWTEIGRYFLDVAAMSSAGQVRQSLQSRAGSLAFGFEVDLEHWYRDRAILTTWIESLRDCKSPQRGLVLAIIVISASRRKLQHLDTLRGRLAEEYKNNADVLVLPMLEAVRYEDLKMWQGQLIALAGTEVSEGDLATLTTDFFPDDEQTVRLAQIWDRLRERISKAWTCK